MNNILNLASASALALMIASPVLAQSRILGVEALNTEIDDITRDVNKELARGGDADRFGPNGVAQGWRGSFALSASGTSGNTDNGEISGAGRVTYGVGDWNHLFGFALEYGEANGVKNEETFFATYEGNRYFTPEFYMFGIARYEYDGYSVDSFGNTIPGSETDAFLGFGPGYRVLNAPDQTWRIQAGPGVRYFKNVNGVSTTEVGFIASSRFYQKFTDTVSFTMDTDVLGSEENTILANDAGINFKVSDSVATRLGYRTEYNTDPVGGRKSTDNKLTASIVFGF